MVDIVNRALWPQSRDGAFWSCGLLWDETRKQNPCIAMADRAMLVRRQAVVGVELGGEDAATSAGAKGKLGAGQNSGFLSESHETRQNRGDDNVVSAGSS